MRADYFKKIPNLNYVWASLVVEELCRQGADYFCIAPGSRSSPLTVAVATNPKAKSFIHYDERGLGFYALGFVSALCRPAVVIVTSGTAVANLFPSVIEASKKKLPLIVLTADRPPELRKTGADQTIEQPGMFGEYVRWQMDCPCPDLNIKPAVVLTTIGQAVYRANGNPPGPVHLNCMFREPLSPSIKEKIPKDYFKELQPWLKEKNAYSQYIPSEKSLSRHHLSQMAHMINHQAKNGIIVVGKLNTAEERTAVGEIAAKLNWPVFPDITSGLRLGRGEGNVIAHFDQILLSEKVMQRLAVDCVLHLGGRITSKRWGQFILKKKPAHYVMVLNHPLRNDPLHQVTLRVEANAAQFCNGLLPLIAPKTSDRSLKWLRNLSLSVAETMDVFQDKEDVLSEPMVARVISQNCPAQHALFLASSMPIRDMDMYAASGFYSVTIGANRGASGIDGTVASAVGFAQGLKKPVTLLIGDLALLHDLNSLAMVARSREPVVVVVLNNDGGAIFSFLPIARMDQKNLFEKYFATPHHLEFASAARMFGLNYFQPRRKDELLLHYQKALAHRKSAIVEIKTNRETNWQVHQDLQKKIMSALNKMKGTA